MFHNTSQAYIFALGLFHQNDWTGKHIEIPYCVIGGPSSIEKKSKTKLVKLVNATVSTAEQIYSYKSKLHKRSIRTDFVTTQNELGGVKLSLWNKESRRYNLDNFLTTISSSIWLDQNQDVSWVLGNLIILGL